MNKVDLIKKRLFEIIERSSEKDFASRAYDAMMLVAIVVGLIPLTLKADNKFTVMIDIITSALFLFDYLARLYTADYKMGFKNYRAYIAYFLSPMAIIDFLSIIPVVVIIFPSMKAVGVFKLLRLVRVFRVLKFIRYSKSWYSIMNVFRKVKKQLGAVLILAMVYILAVAMVMFQVEPTLFDNFFDAIYWSTISITTIGYGDIAPLTTFGRMINVLSSLVGVAVIALPTGIITAAYTDEIKKVKGAHEL